MNNKGIYITTCLAALLAFAVVMMGAYTRLTDAGLGCPDWPLCYGQLTVPESTEAVAKAEQLYPNQPVEAAKGWAEMIHRYLASSLGLLILILTIWFWRHGPKLGVNRLFPTALLGLVILQGMLGMWTVTWLLVPFIVLLHLLGGITIFCLLARLAMSLNPNIIRNEVGAGLRIWAMLALLVVFVQVALGGWTSTNYAALVCPGLPMCFGAENPMLSFSEAFQFIMPIGVNYEGGMLDFATRAAIHMTHRAGAMVTLVVVGWLGLRLAFSKKYPGLRKAAALSLFVLLIQISLGILNVKLLLPLPIAVAHNAVGALLLLSMVNLNYRIK